MSLYQELLALQPFEITSDTELEVTSDDEESSGRDRRVHGQHEVQHAAPVVTGASGMSAPSVGLQVSSGSTLSVVTEPSLVEDSQAAVEAIDFGDGYSEVILAVWVGLRRF